MNNLCMKVNKLFVAGGATMLNTKFMNDDAQEVDDTVLIIEYEVPLRSCGPPILTPSPPTYPPARTYSKSP